MQGRDPRRRRLVPGLRRFCPRLRVAQCQGQRDQAGMGFLRRPGLSQVTDKRLRPALRHEHAACPFGIGRPQEIVEHVGRQPEMRGQSIPVLGRDVKPVQPIEPDKLIAGAGQDGLPPVMRLRLRHRGGRFHQHDPGPARGEVGAAQHVGLRALGIDF